MFANTSLVNKQDGLQTIQDSAWLWKKQNLILKTNVPPSVTKIRKN